MGNIKLYLKNCDIKSAKNEEGKFEKGNTQICDITIEYVWLCAIDKMWVSVLLLYK